MQRIIALLRAMNTDDLASYAGQSDKTLPTEICELCSALKCLAGTRTDLENTFSEALSPIAISNIDLETLYKIHLVATATSNTAVQRLTAKFRSAYVSKIRNYYINNSGLLDAYVNILRTMHADRTLDMTVQLAAGEAIELITQWLPQPYGNDAPVIDNDVSKLAQLFKKIYEHNITAQGFFLYYSLFQTIGEHLVWIKKDIQDKKEQQKLVADLLKNWRLAQISEQLTSFEVGHRRIIYAKIFEQLAAYTKTATPADIKHAFVGAFDLYAKEVGHIYACLDLLMHMKSKAPRGMQEYIDLSIDKLRKWRENNRYAMNPQEVSSRHHTITHLGATSYLGTFAHYALKDVFPAEFYGLLQQDANIPLEAQFERLFRDATSLSHIPAMVDNAFCYQEHAKHHFMQKYSEWQIRNAYSIMLEARHKPFYISAAVAAIPDSDIKPVTILQRERTKYISELVCREFIDTLAKFIRDTDWQLGFMGGEILLGTNKKVPKRVAAIYQLCLTTQQDGKWQQHFDEITRLGNQAANAWSISIFGLNRRSASTKHFYRQFKLFYENARKIDEQNKKHVRMAPHVDEDERRNKAKLCQT